MSDSVHDNNSPWIHWDGQSCEVLLPMLGGGTLTAKWNPDTTYVVRIRKAGTSDWSVGFETPVTGGTFRGLDPDTEYEVEFCLRSPAGEVESIPVRFRTDPVGQGGEVIPFPKR